jgi:ComF family protein
MACATARYGDPLRALILALKFGGGLQAAPLLARLLAQRIRDTRLTEGATIPVLVPVPLAASDFSRRGFNQAQEISSLAARHLGLEAETKALQKTRATAPQALLDAQARRENLMGAFRTNARFAKRHAKGMVILVDDVMTTCTTASECAKTLREAGIGEVRVAVIARG